MPESAPKWTRVTRTTLKLPACELLVCSDESDSSGFWFWMPEELEPVADGIGYVSEDDARFAALYWYVTGIVIDPMRNPIMKSSYKEVDRKMVNLYEKNPKTLEEPSEHGKG